MILRDHRGGHFPRASLLTSELRKAEQRPGIAPPRSGFDVTPYPFGLGEARKRGHVSHPFPARFPFCVPLNSRTATTRIVMTASNR
jgi:hypothetical protein